jgi:hypothetical protein
MRPHTGAYCSVQTVGRRALESLGSSCAVTVQLATNACEIDIADSGDARASPTRMAARAIFMVNSPNIPSDFSPSCESERERSDSPEAIQSLRPLVNCHCGPGDVSPQDGVTSFWAVRQAAR